MRLYRANRANANRITKRTNKWNLIVRVNCSWQLLMHDDVKGYVLVSLFSPSSKLIFFTPWVVSDQFERNETSFDSSNTSLNWRWLLRNIYIYIFLNSSETIFPQWTVRKQLFRSNIVAFSTFFLRGRDWRNALKKEQL